jgi:TRAP-type transport system periplasmic protein
MARRPPLGPLPPLPRTWPACRRVYLGPLPGAVLAGCLAVAATVTPAHAEDRRVATMAPEGSQWFRQLRRAATRLSRLTDGRITIKFYAGGAQGDEREMVRKMRLGQLDGAALTSVGLSLIYPGIRVLELPYLYDSVDEVDYVRARMLPYFRQRFAERGAVLLALSDVGWIHVFSSQSWKSVDELRSRGRLWAWDDDPLVRKLFRRVEVDGIPLGVAQVLSALRRGQIDTCYGSPLIVVALQWHSHLSYMWAEPVAYGVAGLVVSQSAWSRSSAADQNLEQKLFARASAAMVALLRRDNHRALRAMMRHGLRVVAMPRPLALRLREAALSVRREMLGSFYTQHELELVLKYRAEFRARSRTRQPQRGAAPL